MLVGDEPLAMNLTQTQRQPKLERLLFAVGTRLRAAHRGDGKRHIRAGRDVKAANLIGNWIAGPRKEKIPRLSISIEPTKLEGWWYVEHNEIGNMAL